MSASALRDSQMLMARYLRDPQGQPAPEGVEERRLKIYRDLVYNNVEGFISGGFPVLRSLYQDEDWHQLVREFIDQHRCHTPYFLEISQEFLKFLMQRDEPGPMIPRFCWSWRTTNGWSWLWTYLKSSWRRLTMIMRC